LNFECSLGTRKKNETQKYFRNF